MKKQITLGLMSLSLLFSACGEKGGADGEKASGEKFKNEFNIEVSSDEEDLSAIDFKHAKVFTFGRNVGKDKNRQAHVVVFSNQEIKLSKTWTYAEQPQAGQYYVILEFLGEISTDPEGFPEPLEPGTYDKLDMFKEGKAVDVFCYAGDAEGQNKMILSGKRDESGSATLDKVSSKGIAGSANIQYKGFSLKTDFNLPVSEDFWPKLKEQMENMRKLSKMK
jgi:hypothetical protein